MDILSGLLLLGIAAIKSSISGNSMSEEAHKIDNVVLKANEESARRASHNQNLSQEQRQRAADRAKELRQRRQEAERERREAERENDDWLK